MTCSQYIVQDLNYNLRTNSLHHCQCNDSLKFYCVDWLVLIINNWLLKVLSLHEHRFFHWWILLSSSQTMTVHMKYNDNLEHFKVTKIKDS